MTDATRRLDGLRTTVDRLLRQARPHASPLFVDYLGGDPRVDAYQPLFGRDQPIALSNFAAQQQLIRLLQGLTRLTGDGQYETAARDAAGLMFRRFTDPSGLLAWGGHMAVTLPEQQVAFESAKSPVHELKCAYPDYAFLWSVSPEATKQFIEAFWNAHVLDWRSLDFNRHGTYLAPRGKLWHSTFGGTPVFFWGRGLTFVNTGSDLYYAAAMLSRLSGDPLPLAWAKRLAGRYIETRQPPIGISGYQFSQCADAWCDGPGVRGDRVQYAYGPIVPAEHRLVEGMLFKPRPVVQRCQLQLGAELSASGADFVTWASDELRAWMRVAYRPQDNTFIPMLTDGYSLEGLTMVRDGYYGPRGRAERGLVASTDFLWAYTSAYRATGDPEFWPIIVRIAAATGVGEPGARPDAPFTSSPTPLVDRRAVHALLDLYHATGSSTYLTAATHIADGLLASCSDTSGLSPRQPHPAPVDDLASNLLAVLHTCAALADHPTELRPAFV